MGDGGGTPRGTEVVKGVRHGHGDLRWGGCDRGGHGRVGGTAFKRGSGVVVVLIGEGRVGGRILATTGVVVIRIVTHGLFVYARVHGVVLIGLYGGMSGARRMVVAGAVVGVLWIRIL